ncbi:cyclin-like protein [Peniophora sp. CONT]|nr:cyclin-like protein [Peniophora sp. CONT]
MPACPSCAETVIEYDHASGSGFCMGCGTVVEENAIVNEVSFGETSTGAAMVQGAYVGQGATHARMGGPFGNRGSNESREQTIANAQRKITSIAHILRLSDNVSLAATRLYTLAVEHKFTKGRKSLNVVAVCLYIACRQKETRNYMLIDFSDLLQVNVFELGHTYLQLVQTLNLQLPLVDPSHYVARFAALLEFGDETQKVTLDAIRLVQRFDRDWMTKGRRPAGICGACLLLAARMNNFRRSVEEVVQVVKIADTTLRKRLEEFKNTPSGALTLTDFRTVWLDEEMDPPAYTKGKEKEMEEAEDEEGMDEDANGKKRKRKKGKEKGKGEGRKKKRKKRRVGIDDSDEEAEATPEPELSGTPAPPAEPLRPYFDPALLNQGIFAGTSQSEPLFFPDPADESPESGVNDENIDPELLGISQSFPSSSTLVPTQDSTAPSQTSTQAFPSTSATLVEDLDKAGGPDLRQNFGELPEEHPADASASAVLADEVTTFLHNAQGEQLVEALQEADERRRAQIEVVDELLGLDEDELDAFLLNEDEIKLKERVWVEMNRDYLEAIAARGEQQETGETKKTRKRRKSASKPRDASTPSGNTAAESVKNLLKKSSKYSKRINYDALKGLFSEDGAGKTEDKLYTFEDDKEEEEAGDADDYVTEAGTAGVVESDKEDDWAAEDVYEQEV